MSRMAWSFLALTLMSGLLAFTGPVESGLEVTLTKGAACLFGTGFFFALLVGRRFKFDPVLR
ncbi:PA3371 family protein [Stutzerimonas azotifigens]|uniref:PA3371 family protein n=1 Tax=Stutzerimonas azotifigens TaxID=291995 RepID=UPI000429BDCE|nr:PA3371 family protein [Stutzerimonas azotifigens]